mgnify:CR=1 FL=1
MAGVIVAVIANLITDALLKLMAPLLSFTAEEAWKVLKARTGGTIFTETYAALPPVPAPDGRRRPATFPSSATHIQDCCGQAANPVQVQVPCARQPAPGEQQA